MMKPTKVWKFDEIYSIEVLDGRQLNAKVLIDWTCGQVLYERACDDLNTAMNTLAMNSWTPVVPWHGQIGTKQEVNSFSISNQFVDEAEALRLADEFKDILKGLSKLL